MGLLRGRGTLDPRYFRHATPVIEGDMTAHIVILRPHDGTEEPFWDKDLEQWLMPDNDPIWEGMARIQPNKDWRARNREFAREETAEHAVRVQVEFGSNTIDGSDGVLPEFRLGDRVRVLSSPHDNALEDYIFTVRNPISSSNAWLRNLLCDVDLGASNVGVP